MITKKKGKVAIYDGLRCSPGSDPQETKKGIIDSFNTAMIIKKIWKLMKILGVHQWDGSCSLVNLLPSNTLAV